MLHHLVTQYLINRLIDENHPTIEYNRCVNQKQRRKECVICQDACPKQVIRYDKKQPVDWKECANCNICVSLCPSRAIRSSSVNMNKLLTGYEAKGMEVVIGCQREEGDIDVKLYCMGSVPWEVLAGYAMTKIVRILSRRCGDCPDKECLSAFQETCERLREFLGEKLYRERIILVTEDMAAPQKLLSRREMFQLMFSKSKEAIGSLLPEDESLKMDGMLYRRILAYRLQHPEHLAVKQRAFGWRSPVFNGHCWACGICAKICPHQAIEISGLDGTHRRMTHILWKCEGCGICETVCLEHAIDGTKVVYTDHPLKVVNTAVCSLTCPECGAPVKPEDGPLCMACSQKRRRQAARMSSGGLAKIR